jgi:hypothetical protein
MEYSGQLRMRIGLASVAAPWNRVCSDDGAPVWPVALVSTRLLSDKRWAGLAQLL